MKAKEYLLKYEAGLRGSDFEKVGFNLLMEFCTESLSVIKERHIQMDSDVVSLIKEFNQKWNSLVILLENKGIFVLLENGFKNFMVKKMPELKGRV